MSFPTLWGICGLLSLVQVVAALPWLVVVDPRTFRNLIRRPVTWAALVGLVVGVGLVLAGLLAFVQIRERLEMWGRVYATVLEAQLIADFFVVTFGILLPLWPRGGAVALSAFREGVRQPLFWCILGLAVMAMLVSIFIPFYTFGDNYKMMKHIGFDIAMLAAVLFGVVTAGLSITDEIEGRTAITLMSKPVSRRQFLLGKFLGIFLASLALTGILSWAFQWVLYIYPYFDWMPDTSDPIQAQVVPRLLAAAQGLAPAGVAGSYLRGVALWFADTASILPGLVIGTSQVMVLLGIAVALSTRLPMVLTLVACLFVFFLGHLAPVLDQVVRNQLTEYAAANQGQTSGTLELVQFMTRLLDTLAPALEYFKLGPAISRDRPLPLTEYGIYVGSVVLYSLMYTAIAMLFGLILFEDRDLA